MIDDDDDVNDVYNDVHCHCSLNGQFMEKVNHYNRTKHKDFLMGPSVKFVLAIIDSVSPKKWT